MSRNLSQILYDVNSYVDLEYALPTGDELYTRANYANQAVWDASAVAQLDEFTRTYEVNPGTASSVTLPRNFREFKISPQQLVNGTWVEFPEVLPEERYQKNAGDKYCYVMGNPMSGYIAYFNNLEANCTLSVTHQAYPSGMATLSDICELSDPMYVVNKVESYVLQARGDDRFPYVDAQAEKRLRNMIGRDMKSPGGQYRVAPAGFKNPLTRHAVIQR